MARVDWLASAEEELADCWTRADAAGRRAITAASHLIDLRLAVDPANEGESRPGGTRITFEWPIAVRFEVSSDGQIVTVLHVRRFGRPKR